MSIYFDYTSIVSRKHPSFLRDSADWLEWRYCYEGGRMFRNTYLQPFSDRETQADFERRMSMTPIPAFAKKEINKIKNSLFQKFVDIIRRDGSKLYQDAAMGNGKGVDGKGSSMNAFIGKECLSDLLVMGKVGILVDAPRIRGESLADVPKGWSPYLSVYPIESMPLLVPADNGQASDFKAAMVVDRFFTSDFAASKYDSKVKYRWYYINPDTNLVEIQLLADDRGTKEGDPIKTKLRRIPLVVVDISASLIQDACSYQKALLNLISSDTAYGTEANFPFLTRMRKNPEEGGHLLGENKEQKAGAKKGLTYEYQTERPGFINPSSEPLKLSLELRRELKNEIRELISGQLEAIGQDGTVSSGLAFIGLMLESAENQIADSWAEFENSDPARQRSALIKYPECWDIRQPKERIEEASALAETMYKIPGQKVKKEIAKLVADTLLRGRVPTKVMDEIFKEIDEAKYCTSDPQIILDAKREGIISAETSTVALGCPPEEAEKAKNDQAERAATIVAAQTDAAAGAAKGNPDGSADPNSTELAREGDSDTTAKLGGDDEPGVRGKSDSAS